MFSSISNILMNFSIQARLAVSFVSLALIIAVISFTTIWQVNHLNDLSHRVTDLRIPTVEASANVLSGTNQALAALRGWMLLNNEKFKEERASVWREQIEPSLAVLDKMSASWTNPENVTRLKELEGLLAAFEREQQKIEDMANTPENIPAIKLLFEQAAPQADIMLSNITRLIDLEAKQEATAERKALLGMMADVRGTIGLSLANIRAYLLSGEAQFKTKYEALWAKNERRFNDLGNKTALLTKAQLKAYELLAGAREVFSPLPPQMIEMRSRADWNLANHWLATEAAPIGAQIQQILESMKASQTDLLALDSIAIDDEGAYLTNTAWVMFVVGLLLTSFLAIVITRSVTGPVNQLKTVMKKVGGEFDLSLRIDNSSADEIGQMAREFNRMLETFDHLILKIASSSTQLSGSAEELHAISSQSHEGISRQQSETEQVATAITQMSATVQEVARNAADASSATTEAEAQVNEGSAIVAQVGRSIHTLAGEVDEATGVIHALEEESNNIGGVLDVIRGIAEQTNLLALNAAIEAARAGEQGRGFAVVADEVRTLASRTQESTQEIQKMIERLQGGAQTAVKKMDRGLVTTRANVDLANKATEALDQITNSVSTMTQMNLQIASAAEEQSSVVDEINHNVVAINDISQLTATGAKETVTASEQLSMLASELQTVAGRFKTS